MQTECSPTLFEFEAVDGKKIVAGFDGGTITSDSGVLLRSDLRGARRQAGGQAGGLRAADRQLDPQPRLEHKPKRATGKYHEIDYDAARLKALFVDLFLEAHKRRPKEIVLGLDATDDPIHGDQEGHFFHDYYDCYCYLPLYILYFLRPLPARRQAVAGEHRRCRGRRRGGVPDRRPDPRPLAQDADHAARRIRLLPRGANGVVRDKHCRLPNSGWPEQLAESGGGARGVAGQAAVRADRPAGPAGCSGTSRIRPGRAEVGPAGSPAKPSICRPAMSAAAPIPASWSPLFRANVRR